MYNDTFEMVRGSDLEFQFNWPDAAGANFDLSGQTVSIFEPSAALAGKASIAVLDAPTGLCAGLIQWDAAYKTGRYLSFYIQRADGALTQSIGPFWVTVK